MRVYLPFFPYNLLLSYSLPFISIGLVRDFKKKKNKNCLPWLHKPLIPAIREAEAGGTLWVWGQAGLQSEFQDSQSYTEKLCLENKTKLNQTKQPNKKQNSKQNKKQNSPTLLDRDVSSQGDLELPR